MMSPYSTGAFTALAATGKSTLADAAIAAADIDSGNIDGTAIGAAAASSGSFTTLGTGRWCRLLNTSGCEAMC